MATGQRSYRLRVKTGAVEFLARIFSDVRSAWKARTSGLTQPTKVAARSAVPSARQQLLGLFVDGTWNVPTSAPLKASKREGVSPFMGLI